MSRLYRTSKTSSQNGRWLSAMSVANCHAHANKEVKESGMAGGREEGKRGSERGRDLIPYGRIFVTFVDASVWLGGSPRNRTARSHERTRGTLGYHWHFSCNELFRRGKLQVRYRIGFAQYVVIFVCTRAGSKRNCYNPTYTWPDAANHTCWDVSIRLLADNLHFVREGREKMSQRFEGPYRIPLLKWLITFV